MNDKQKYPSTPSYGLRSRYALPDIFKRGVVIVLAFRLAAALVLHHHHGDDRARGSVHAETPISES